MQVLETQKSNNAVIDFCNKELSDIYAEDMNEDYKKKVLLAVTDGAAAMKKSMKI